MSIVRDESHAVAFLDHSLDSGRLVARGATVLTAGTQCLFTIHEFARIVFAHSLFDIAGSKLLSGTIREPQKNQIESHRDRCR